MMAASHLPDDLGIRLLGLAIAAKKTEEAAQRALGESLKGPSTLVPSFHRTWSEAKTTVWNVHREVRRTCRRTVIPFIPKATAR